MIYPPLFPGSIGLANILLIFNIDGSAKSEHGQV